MVKAWDFTLSERVCRDDAADVAEADLPGAPYCATVMATKVHGEPADNDWHGCVGAAGDEEQCAVFNMVRVVDVH